MVNMSFLFSLLVFSGLSFGLPGFVYAAEEKPLYYGWFFNETIATGLAELTQDILRDFNQNVPDFRKQLSEWSTGANVTNPLNYYTKPLDPNSGKFDPYYHITAKYCGDVDCPDYSARVSGILGKKFNTSMVGYVFSTRTYGIRVILSPEQEPFFDTESRSVSEIVNMPAELSSPNKHSDLRSSPYPGIEFLVQDSNNWQPSKSRAHVTLGCAPNVSAVTTGTDLLKVIGLEANGTFYKEIKLDSGKYTGSLIQWGDPCQYFVYYPSHGLLANSTFQVYKTSGSSRTNVFNFIVPILALYYLLKRFW